MAGELERALTSMILLALVVVGIGIFVGDFANNYPTTAQNVSASNFTFLNKASEINSNMSDISETLQTQQGESVNFLETSYNIIAGAFGVIMQLFTVGDLMIGLVGGFAVIAAGIGIDLGWATAIIFTLILTMVTIWILRAVLKWEL